MSGGEDLDTMVLPCGCLLRSHRTVDGDRELQIVPCRRTCANYQASLNLALESGKPVLFRRAP